MPHIDELLGAATIAAAGLFAAIAVQPLPRGPAPEHASISQESAITPSIAAPLRGDQGA